MMTEDAVHDWSFIATMIVGRRSEGLPAHGFFNLEVEPERFPADPAGYTEARREEFERVMEAR